MGLLGRVRTASDSLASAFCDEVVKGGIHGRLVAEVLAPRLNSSSMRWAMISVSVSETNLWPLAMRALLRER